MVRNLQRKVKVDVPPLKRLGEGVLQGLGRGNAECGLLLVGDAKIARLNQAYLKEEGPTDVISFPLLVPTPPPSPSPWTGEGKGGGANPQLLGDVVISVETAKRQADRKRRPLQEEMAHLLIHGILHLLGYDHPTPNDRRRMRLLERRFLAPFFPRKKREA